MITLSRKTFLDGLLLGGSLSNKKALVPFMSQVLCELRDGMLTLSSCDNESYVESTIDIVSSTEEDGFSFSFQPTEMLSLLRSISDSEVSIRFESNMLLMTYSTGEISMPTGSSKDFIKPDMDDVTDYVLVNSDILGDALKEAREFVGSNPVRSALMGVYLHLRDGRLHIAGTDGAFLYANSIECPHECPPMQGIVRTIGGVLSVLSTSCDAKLCIGSRRLYVRTPVAMFSTLLIDSRYPAYEKIIPTSFMGYMVASTSLLANAIKRVSLFSERNTNKITLNVEDNVCEISAVDTDNSYRSREALDVTNYDTKISFAVCSTRILTSLRCMNCENIKMAYNGNSRPVVLKSTEDENKTIVVLPMQ